MLNPPRFTCCYDLKSSVTAVRTFESYGWGALRRNQYFVSRKAGIIAQQHCLDSSICRASHYNSVNVSVEVLLKWTLRTSLLYTFVGGIFGMFVLFITS